jgi:diamine N-acetyltransferase
VESDDTQARFGSFAIWAALTSAREDADRPATIRSVADGAEVTLEEVTEHNVRAICRLMVAPAQARFVAPNAISVAQAHFSPQAWFRAVAADGVPVGFVMLYEEPEKAEYTLWRFMIDARHQGKGYGRAAIGLVLDHVRTLPGATELKTSWVATPGGPAPFYAGLGFRETGEMDEDEVVGSIAL